MAISKKIWRFIVDLIEIYIPAACFLAMFLAFLLQIFTRYVMGSQVPWTYEVTVVGFMWVVAFGACHASRLRHHVSFSMIYDKLGVVGQSIIEVISNMVIVGAFVIMFLPVIEFVVFMQIKKTAVMRVPIGTTYAPFIFFIVHSTIYIISDIVKAIKKIKNHKKEVESE